MEKIKRNSLAASLTILVVLISSASAYFILDINRPKKKESGHLLYFAADSGKDSLFSVDNFNKMRDYISYRLTADLKYNTKLLTLIKQQLNLIKQNRDTVRGVHIIMDDSTPYASFIKAVDICAEKEPRAFAPNKNDIYAWYVNIPKNNRQEPMTDK